MIQPNQETTISQECTNKVLHDTIVNVLSSDNTIAIDNQSSGLSCVSYITSTTGLQGTGNISLDKHLIYTMWLAVAWKPKV